MSDRPAIPDEDRTWDLVERAFGKSGGITVLGWADNMVVELAGQFERHQFEVVQVPRSHEDEVLILAIRVPHPDEMSLAEVVLGCPCCQLDGTHDHEKCVHPCCPDEGE